MQKWQWFAGLGILSGVLMVGWLLSHKPTDAPVVVPEPDHTTPLVKNRDQGNTEESEVIEPLIVEHWTPPQTAEPPAEDVPASRVLWTPDIEIPPRPDEQSEMPLRMPYADE